MLGQREESERVVAQCKALLNDSSWQLRSGAIIYVGDEQHPNQVIRSGYDIYEHQIRVDVPHEDFSRWSTGRWVGTDKCHKLEVNDKVEATLTITAVPSDERIVPQGVRCIFRGWDADGDAILSFKSWYSRMSSLCLL